MTKAFEGSRFLNGVISLVVLIGLGWACFQAEVVQALPVSAFRWLLTWLFLATIFSVVMPKEFAGGFLLTLFSLLIAWRIVELYDLKRLGGWLSLAFVLLLANFTVCAWRNLHQPQRYVHALSLGQWQLTFIRLYIGFDFIPHFTEKLFAGPKPYLDDVQAFVSLGVPHADFFVYLAGLCEFGAAIALGLGFMMRLGAVGAAVYLGIATYLGHHFSLGFIWANHGGGWEFAVLWLVFILSFALSGAHEFSVDQCLEDRLPLPKAVKACL